MTVDARDEKAIFLAALEQAGASEREAYIRGACAGDDELLQRLKVLLSIHEQSQGPFDAPPPGVGISPTIDEPTVAERPGNVIGPYKLLQQIGEGGMGTVFMAQQTEPVKRAVALKIIKAGMDTRQVIARFEAERQALALMDHPNIAKVLDAGTVGETRGEGRETSQESAALAPDLLPLVPRLSPLASRPYFVMELVKGVSITKYCDEHCLTPRQRLELFIPVCQAVQHAHQKGIIHRDLKPSNIMIAQYDGRPVPKVIDFGVAKAAGQQLTDKTLMTGLGSILGTLEYMSPEQAEINQLDIDTRSDIYSLGVVLYELLTGSTPLDRKRLKQAAFTEMLRIIREEEPQKPSTRLSDSTDSLPSISAQRQMEPAKLTRSVRGELDWIVMKALEKDRNRRYETANGFAADVQHYLHDEAVLACPPSAGYRFRKFARRNKRAMATAALLLAVVLAGAGAAVWQAVRATKAEMQALTEAAATARERDNKEAALANAKEELATREAVLDFVENKIFAAARPKRQAGGMGYDVKLADALNGALPFVENSFKDQPLIEARLRSTLGISFTYLGKPSLAADQFQAALATYRKHRDPDDPNTLRSMNNLAGSYNQLGRPADALKLLEESLAIQRAKSDPDDPALLASLNNLASSYARLGRHAEALRLNAEALALRKAKLGPNDPDTLRSMSNLAGSYAALNRHVEAVKLFEQTLALQKVKPGPDHPEALKTMNSLAASYAALGKLAESLRLFQETLELRKAKLGPDHLDTLASMSNLAGIYSVLGRDADALKLCQETLALQKAKLPTGHPHTLRSMHSLAVNYAKLGRHAEALKLYEETLAPRKAKLGADHPDTLTSLCGMAGSLVNLNRGTEAVPVIDEFVQRATGQIVDPRLLPVAMNLRLRHFEKARDAAGCRATAEKWEKLKRADASSLYAAACMRAVTGVVLLANGKSEEAVKEAAAEVDRAMAWLKQAVAAGFKDAAHMAKDKDLDSLRDRDDFKLLVAELEAAKKQH